MDVAKLKKEIKETIFPNGEKKIKGQKHQDMLFGLVDEIDRSDGLMRADIALNQETAMENRDNINDLRDETTEKFSKVDTSISDINIRETETSKELDNIKNALRDVTSGKDNGQVTGGKVINIPTQATNSVAGYKIGGLTATQLVQNGDFKDGIKGWNSAGFSLSAENKEMICTPNMAQSTPFLFWDTKSRLNEKDKYYLYSKGQLSNNLCRSISMRIGDVEAVAVENPDRGVFFASQIITIWGPKIKRFELITKYQSKEDTEGGIMTVSFFGSINLTDIFGAGNEPTKEWCDAHFKDYFDGIKSVELPVRIKSVGENLFDYLDSNNHTKYTKIDNGYITGNIGGALITVLRFKVYKDTPYCLSFLNRNKVTTTALKYSIQTSPGAYNANNTLWITAEYIDENQVIKSTVITPKEDGYHHFIVNTGTGATDIMLGKGEFVPYKKYKENLSYINSKATLKSALQAKDYVENGTLFKNIFTTKEFKKDDIRSQYINENLVNTYAFYFDIEENVWLKEGFVNKNRVARFSDGETYSCVNYEIVKDVEDIVFFVEGGKNYIMLKINKAKIDKLSGDIPLDKFKAYMGSRSLIINYRANTEQVKLGTSGVVTTYENGTIFIENIKNVTDFYTANGLDVKDFKELVSIYKYEGSDLVQLDASKAVFATTLKHPDLQDGDLVFFEYKYLDSPLWGDNEIEYFNKNNVLQSENGKLWRKVEVATNDGQLTTKLEEVK